MSTKYQVPSGPGPRQAVLLAAAVVVLILGSIVLVALTVDQLQSAHWLSMAGNASVTALPALKHVDGAADKQRSA
mgnify:CR=1 FL=1